MTALIHPQVTTAADGEDVAIDQWPNRAVVAEIAGLNPGESIRSYFADGYDWSLLSRLLPDPGLIAAYSDPIRVPIDPSRFVRGGSSGGSMDGGAL